VPLSTDEEKYIVEDVCDDMLGFGPLEPLLARDDITDIMIYGPDQMLHRGQRRNSGDRRALSR
jgi:Flp pilus assembly CpaF family ATPase